MRNFSIRVKLMVFFGTVMLLLLIVAGSGWLATRSVGEQLGTLSGERLPAILNLLRMRTWQLVSISENRNVMSFNAAAYDAMEDKSVGVEEGKAYFSEVLKTKLDADAQAQRYFDQYQHLPKAQEERDKWRLLQADWKIYLESNAATVDALKRLTDENDWRRMMVGTVEFANFDGLLRRQSQRIQSQLDALIALNQAYAKAATDDGDRARQRGYGLMFSMTSLALLVCGAGAWWLTRSVTVPLRNAVKVARRVADGDLAFTVEARSTDETGQLMLALKDMNGSLAHIVGRVRSGTDTIATASREIAIGNGHLSVRTEQQAATLEQTTASIFGLIATVKENSERARHANQLAISASEIARKGGEVIDQVVSTMSAMNASAQRIVDIIAVIDGIAFQTNILALNAAVEAARAGAEGRGFAVVAAEVRTLAHRSASAAKEIKSLIGGSVASMAAGGKLVEQAGVTMDEIVTGVGLVTDVMREISAAGAEQAAGLDQINVAMRKLDEVTQQNASLVEEATAASEVLQRLAGELMTAVYLFKLDDAQAAGTTATALPAPRMGDAVPPWLSVQAAAHA
ncbi:HAMP domain-containing protein [Duganella sp. LX20W]|uniref:HAMP domain-containing protein n=1 Tax=Rugamonas brunnea TaxID=2758569 RepID=A0A7W2EWX2_9BURK|nr:methyl-accepting chemotaxis protein [Rugamonas brunnea]MBA5640075.1 HAMP domain-containing protein [Rugamonas brunnea]